MIKRFRFGDPIETDAIQKKPALCSGEIPCLTVAGDTLTCELAAEDIVYGLGENVRGINKRGWHYVSNCADDPNHTENKQSLYGAHNFLVIAGEKNFGVFVDTPGKVTFDVGYTCYHELKITVADGAYELYVIENGSAEEIVQEFRGLIGQSYIPPKWAFGYGQCRWSYMTSDEVREVARGYRENGIPLDMIYLDIDYMERYKDFTINRETFADFEQLVEDMRAQGIRLVPIIDGGVKAEPGYEVYEEGIEKGYFCKDEEGKEFVVGVWPGKCCFPDMLNEEAGRWFGEKYRFLTDKGIEGFWNDMNEPAIFYSEKRLKKVFDKIDEYKNMENLDIHSFFDFTGLVGSIANNEEDYRSFYHNYRGQCIRHDKVHNLFGYYMTRSAGEALERISPDKRLLLFSRASYIGMHRYGGIWMGDNQSWWSHLLMNLKMLPSLNMCGFLYTGADLAGFGSDTTEDLALRWMALGIFTPLMRNHAAMGTRRQEVYAFENKEAFRDIISLRYRMLPYLYSEFVKAALKGTMYARPLGFVWPEDKKACHTEDQLMIGESIMIAPVYEQNAIGRTVYLPEEMKLVRFRKGVVVEEKVLPAGHHFVEIGLEEVVIFIRKGHLLPLADCAESVAEIDSTKLEIHHFAEEGAYYELYEDDGFTREVQLEGHIREIRVSTSLA